MPTMVGKAASKRYRRFLLDGQLLLFDRESGENQLWTGRETEHYRQQAPRVLQIAITNVCNKTCSFCYRPLDAKSEWTFDDLLQLAKCADEWGVLELAFGGGEPTLFPRFPELLRAIWSETGLCTNFTTNGSTLTPCLLSALRGTYGQIQLSVYDEDDYLAVIDTLIGEGARFGLNYLVTPGRLPTLEADVCALAERGVRDILLLSYKGGEFGLHLSPAQQRTFDAAVERMYRVLADRVALKVDVCWGTRLSHTPRLFETGDCGAGSLFLSITSDRKVLACSFADDGIALRHVQDLPAIWSQLRSARPSAPKLGCARLHGFGFVDALPSPLRLRTI